jgi:hypothetical protein
LLCVSLWNQQQPDLEGKPASQPASASSERPTQTTTNFSQLPQNLAPSSSNAFSWSFYSFSMSWTLSILFVQIPM